MTSIVSSSKTPTDSLHLNYFPAQAVNTISIIEDFSIPAETPLDKEINQAIVDKIIDRCCVLNPDINIDRDIVISCLNACINDELSSRKLSPELTLRSLLLFAVGADDTQLPIEFFSFVGSSVIYKLADAIIKALEASDARALVTPLFVANLKRVPHDSDWKIAVQSPAKDSKISFWDNVEKYTRAILRGVALKHYEWVLPHSFDIPAICKELGIYYDHSPGKHIHIGFIHYGIDLTIGSFAKEGLFKDTLPEVNLVPSSVTENPDDLQTTLDDNLVNIFQAAIFRGCKVLAVLNSENKNDRASVQFLRRSLTGDSSLSESDYPDFIHALFKAYPVSSTWAWDIAKKFCNINKGHSDDPIKRIVWSLFLLLCSLKKFPQYAVTEARKWEVWELLPAAFDQNEVVKLELVKQDLTYQFMLEYQVYGDVLEAVIGIAGLLSLCFTSDCTGHPYSFSRHLGPDRAALCYVVDHDIQLKFEPDLLSFCRSLKAHCADNGMFVGSPLSHKLLDLFMSYSALKEGAFTDESVLQRNAKRLPPICSEISNIAAGFIFIEDPFLNLLGAAILVSLKAYDSTSVNESLLSYVFPLLLSSSDEKVKTFATLLAKKYLSGLAQKEASRFLHPKTMAFSMPAWLNALALTNHPRCCEIAAKHWTLNVPADRKYFQAYLTFMDNLWKAYPMAVRRVWEAMLPHNFNAAEQIQIFGLYADRLLILSEKDLAQDCLEPFIHFINSCLVNLTIKEHSAKLHALLERISTVRPSLVPYCFQWLSLLPEGALPLFKLGTTAEILQEKMAQAKTFEEKNALGTFILQNIRLKGIYFTLVSPQLFRTLGATDHLPLIYQEFIKLSSLCPLQRGRVLLKLLREYPERITAFKKEDKEEIDKLLLELIALEKLPLDLLLRLFQKCHNSFSISGIDFLLPSLFKLTEKVLAQRLNSLRPIVKLICKHPKTSLADNAAVLLDVFKRLIHDEEASWSEALDLAKILVTFSSISITWEHLIHKLNLAAYHQKVDENQPKLLAFSLEFSKDIEKLCKQLDIEILAQEITSDFDKCIKHAELLLAERNNLTPIQKLQLKTIIQRLIRKMGVVNRSAAISWISFPVIKEFLSLIERIELACILLKRQFNSDLFNLVTTNLDKSSLLDKSIFESFVKDLLEGEHLYRDCSDTEGKTQRLLDLVEHKNDKWYAAAKKLLTELLAEKKYGLCFKLFDKCNLLNQPTHSFLESFNDLIVSVPAQEEYAFKGFVELALTYCTLPSHLSWKAILNKLRLVKDEKLVKKCLNFCKTRYPLPSKDTWDNVSAIEKEVYFEALILAHQIPGLLIEQYKNYESLFLILKLFPADRKSTQVLSGLLDYLIAQKSFQDTIPFILMAMDDLSTQKECIQWTLPTCSLLVNQAIKISSKDLIHKTFNKISCCFVHCDESSLSSALAKHKLLINALIANLFSNGIKLELEETITFLLKIAPVLVTGESAWLATLQWLIENEELLIASQKDSFYKLIFMLFASISNGIPKSSLKACLDYFHCPSYLAFIKNLGSQVKALGCAAEFRTYLLLSVRYKLLPENTIKDLSSFMLKCQAENLTAVERLDNYFEEVSLICHSNVLDEEQLELAMDNILKFLSENIDQKKPDQNNQKPFEKFSKRLLNHALCDPRSVGKFFKISFSQPKFGSLSRYNFAHLISKTPFNQTRLSKGIFLFLKKIFADDIIFHHEETYFTCIHTIALYIYAAMVTSKNKGYTEETRDLLKNILLKYLFIPSSKNPTYTSIFTLLLKSVINSGVANELFDKKSEFYSSLSFFRKFKAPLEIVFIKDNIRHVKYFAKECVRVSPTGYFSFLETVSSQMEHLSEPLLIHIGIQLCASLIEPLQTQEIPEQYKSVCIHCLNSIFDKCNLLKINVIHPELTQSADLIRLQMDYLSLLVTNYIVLNEKRFEENLFILEEYAKKTSYAVDEHSFSYPLKLGNLIYIGQMIDNLTLILSKEAYSEGLLKYYKSVFSTLLPLGIYCAQHNENKFINIFLKFFFDNSLLAHLNRESTTLQREVYALSAQALNSVLLHSKDSISAQKMVHETLLEYPTLRKPSDFYPHFDAVNYTYVPLILHGFLNCLEGKTHFEQLSLARTYGTEREKLKEKTQFAYQVLHYCLLIRSSPRSEKLFKDPILLDLVARIYTSFPQAPLTERILSYMVNTRMLSSAFEECHKVILEALESLLSSPKEFEILFQACSEKGWLGGDLLRARKDRLIEAYLKLRNPDDNISFQNTSLEVYIRTLWGEGRFAECYISQSLMQSILTYEANISILEFGIEKAIENKKFGVGLMLALFLVEQFPAQKDSDMIKRAAIPFIHSLPNADVSAHMLSEILNSEVFEKAIDASSKDLWLHFLSVVQAYFTELKIDKILLLLNLFQKALCSELSQNPALFDSENNVEKLGYLQSFIDALIKLYPITEIEIIRWMTHFVAELQKTLSPDRYPKLLLSFLQQSLFYTSLKTCPYMCKTHLLDSLQNLPKTPETVKMACTLYTDYVVITAFNSEVENTFCISVGLEIAKKAVIHNEFAAADKVIKVINIRNDDSNLKAWSVPWIARLQFLKQAFYAQKMLSPLLVCVDMLHFHVPEEVNSIEYHQYYTLACSLEQPYLAAKLASKFRIWNTVDADKLLEILLKDPQTEKDYLIILDVMKETNNRSTRHLNALLLKIFSLNFTKAFTEAFPVFLEKMEEVSIITPETLRKDLWYQATLELSLAKKSFRFKSLFLHPIKAFKTDVERETFLLHQLIVSLRDDFFTRIKLQKLLDIRASISLKKKNVLTTVDATLLSYLQGSKLESDYFSFVHFLNTILSHSTLIMEAPTLIQLVNDVLCGGKDFFEKAPPNFIKVSFNPFITNIFKRFSDKPGACISFCLGIARISVDLRKIAFQYFKEICTSWKLTESCKEAVVEALVCFSVLTPQPAEINVNIIDFEAIFNRLLRKKFVSRETYNTIFNNLLVSLLKNVPLENLKSYFEIYLSTFLNYKKIFSDPATSRHFINEMVMMLIEKFGMSLFDKKVFKENVLVFMEKLVLILCAQSLHLTDDNLKTMPHLISQSNSFWNKNDKDIAILILISEIAMLLKNDSAELRKFCIAELEVILMRNKHKDIVRVYNKLLTHS